jgi:hypothetical protein
MSCHPNDHVWGFLNPQTKERKCVRCGLVHIEGVANFFTPTYISSDVKGPDPIPYTATYRTAQLVKITESGTLHFTSSPLQFDRTYCVGDTVGVLYEGRLTMACVTSVHPDGTVELERTPTEPIAPSEPAT